MNDDIKIFNEAKLRKELAWQNFNLISDDKEFERINEELSIAKEELKLAYRRCRLHMEVE